VCVFVFFLQRRLCQCFVRQLARRLCVGLCVVASVLGKHII
jgi:hypothetical protein